MLNILKRCAIRGNTINLLGISYTSIIMDENGSVHSQYHDLAIHCHCGNRYCVSLLMLSTILGYPSIIGNS